MSASMDERRKEVMATMLQRKAAEDKAFNIVTDLIDGITTAELLAEKAQYITSSHYADIVEERSIEKICGYPLCDNEITNVQKQKYLLTRKCVFDLAKRKCFCSDDCFTRSEHFEKQISTEPVWMRKSKKRTEFSFLSRDQVRDISLPGVLVCETKLSDLEEDIRNLEMMDAKDEIEQTPKKLEMLDTNDKIEDRKSTSSAKSSNTFDARTVNTNSVNVDKTRKFSVLEVVKSTLVEWITMKTYEFVHVKKPEIAAASSHVNIGKRVRFEAAKEEAVTTAAKRLEDPEPDSEIVLPHVDNQSPILVRRRLVFEKLFHVLNDLLRHSSLRSSEIQSDLGQIINTFELSSTNILLKPKEWTLMCVIVLSLLEMKSPATYASTLCHESFDMHVHSLTDATLASTDALRALTSEVLNIYQLDREV